MRRNQRIHQLLQKWGQYIVSGIVVVDPHDVILLSDERDDLKLTAMEFDAIQLNKILLVDRLIQLLEKGQQLLVFLSYVENKDLGIIAEQLGLTKKSVHNQLCRVDIQLEQLMRESR